MWIIWLSVTKNRFNRFLSDNSLYVKQISDFFVKLNSGSQFAKIKKENWTRLVGNFELNKWPKSRESTDMKIKFNKNLKSDAQ